MGTACSDCNCEQYKKNEITKKVGLSRPQIESDYTCRDTIDDSEAEEVDLSVSTSLLTVPTVAQTRTQLGPFDYARYPSLGDANLIF